LGAGDDHRLAQVLQHEGQCRGCVRKCVGAMEHHKAIEELVGLLQNITNNIIFMKRIDLISIKYLNIAGYSGPIVHRHIAAVQQRCIFRDLVDDPTIHALNEGQN